MLIPLVLSQKPGVEAAHCFPVSEHCYMVGPCPSPTHAPRPSLPSKISGTSFLYPIRIQSALHYAVASATAYDVADSVLIHNWRCCCCVLVTAGHADSKVDCVCLRRVKPRLKLSECREIMRSSGPIGIGEAMRWHNVYDCAPSTNTRCPSICSPHPARTAPTPICSP